MTHGVARFEARAAGAKPGPQKREMLQLAAAGALSLVFFSVPVFMMRGAAPGPPAPAAAAQVAAAPASASVRVLTTTVAVDPSIPSLVQPGARSGVRLRRVAARSVRPEATDSRSNLVRRIARLFAGDGRHAVQPFPVVPATNR